MNLIEQLGGYENAKSVQIRRAMDGFLHDYDFQLVDALLEYRRANKIFEAGDKIIFGTLGNDVMVWDDCLSMFLSQGLIRHATDEEIALGRCL